MGNSVSGPDSECPFEKQRCMDVISFLTHISEAFSVAHYFQEQGKSSSSDEVQTPLPINITELIRRADPE